MTALGLFALALFLASIVAWCVWLTHQLTMIEDRQMQETFAIIGLERRMNSMDRRLDRLAAAPVVRE